MDSKRPALKPASPETPEAAAYLPRLPWRQALVALLFVGTVVVGYRLKEQNKADHLRAQILQVHEQQLEPAKQRYRAFREELEGLISSAAEQDPPQTFVDARLNLAGLRKGQGLYLRIPRAAATDDVALVKAAAAMEADNIARCLGLTVSSARGLYDQGAFLDEQWVDEAREENGVMELRVSDEVLARHIKTDLPSVLGLLGSQWFLLVLETGESRRDAPVDVFLWDLKGQEQLLRARVQARGAVLGAHIAMEGAPDYVPKPQEQGGIATDCSIAAQLRALDGARMAEVENSSMPEDHWNKFAEPAGIP